MREVLHRLSGLGLLPHALGNEGGGVGFVVSIAIEEATGGSAGGGDGKSSFFFRFKVEVEAVALESASVLFFVELPPWVFTILIVQAKRK